MNWLFPSPRLPVLRSHHKKGSDATDQLNIRKEISVWEAVSFSPFAVTSQMVIWILRKQMLYSWDRSTPPKDVGRIRALVISSPLTLLGSGPLKEPRVYSVCPAWEIKTNRNWQNRKEASGGIQLPTFWEPGMEEYLLFPPSHPVRPSKGWPRPIWSEERQSISGKEGGRGADSEL